jgi:hypothetical protein
MRSLITLLVLAVALLASSANAFAQISKADAGICGKKNADVVQAIGSFCQRAPYVSFSLNMFEKIGVSKLEEKEKTRQKSKANESSFI